MFMLVVVFVSHISEPNIDAKYTAMWDNLTGPEECIRVLSELHTIHEDDTVVSFTCEPA